MTSNARVAAELLGSGRSTALDIGCGEGKFTRALTRQFGMVAGIDVKERAILAARKAAA
jgi:2-polyprenyl-3-methyl-5-hydroxy-6-metoxy-1,4-benzoquinol methylase